jgi:hypothetical protein
MPPTIAFLTDFGTRDHYVGAMKGAALTVCPDATLVDITHDIAPQDVLGGALALAAAFKFFPAHTIFVGVVDPGVGSPRRALAAAAGEYLFVSPDNGLLTLVFREAEPRVLVDITNAQYARAEVSRTFEGRDRFAPAAAWLACGTSLDALGRRISDWHALTVPAPEFAAGVLRGAVLLVDRFGNLITNIDRRGFAAFSGSRGATVTVGGQSAPVVQTYAEVGPGDVCALFGSSDRLEIAVNGGSAAGRLGAVRGTTVVVTRA